MKLTYVWRYAILLYVKRTTIWLTTQQDKELKIVSKRRGTKIAEIIRRALDEYLGKELKKDNEQ